VLVWGSCECAVDNVLFESEESRARREWGRAEQGGAEHSKKSRISVPCRGTPRQNQTKTHCTGRCWCSLDVLLVRRVRSVHALQAIHTPAGHQEPDAVLRADRLRALRASQRQRTRSPAPRRRCCSSAGARAPGTAAAAWRRAHRAGAWARRRRTGRRRAARQGHLGATGAAAAGQRKRLSCLLGVGW